MSESVNSESAPRNAPVTSGRDAILAVLLGVVFVVSLLSMPAVRYDGDVIAWEMEAESLVYRGTLEVRASVAESLPPSAPYFVFNPDSGKWYSKYGIANTWIYAIPIAAERFIFGGRPPDSPTSIFGKPTGPFEITRRVELFNGFNLLLTLLLATVLYQLANHFTPRRATAAVFVLACLYSTYLWHYSRAQSSQIYQVLLFSAAFLYLVRCVEEARKDAKVKPRTLLCCVLSLALLCAVKTVFLPFIAIFGIAIALAGWDGAASPISHFTSNVRNNFTTYVRCGVVPLLILLAVLLWINNLKFGSPTNMGYERETNLFGGSLANSLPAYLFSPRFSIFIHFPMLAIALLGMRGFWKRHRFEFVVAWALFLTMFFIYANYTYWTGEASYGTRYLLFGLPVVSLPALIVFDRLRTLEPSWLRIIVTASVIAVLLAGSAAQVMVNRLEFHAFFRLRHQFRLTDDRDPELWNYLRSTNTATFNREFIEYGNGGAEPLPMQRVKRVASAERYANLEAAVRAHLSSNHYFW